MHEKRERKKGREKNRKWVKGELWEDTGRGIRNR